MEQFRAVQLRLMGEPNDCRAIAERMVSAGILAITGEAPNRNGDGIRIYGVCPAPNRPHIEPAEKNG